MQNVAVVGSINIDHVLKVKKFPKLGETISAESYELLEGGKGANQASSMGKLGLNVQMFGKIGNDIYGKQVVDNLAKCNVNIKNVISDKENSTGAAFITVGENGNNTIVLTSGANGDIKLKEIKGVLNKILNNDVIVFQMEIPEYIVWHVISKAKEANKLVILNLAPAVNINNSILNKVDYLIINEVEAEFLTKKKCSVNRMKLIIKELRKFYQNKIIITLGSIGAVYSILEEDYKIIPAFKVKSVDQTGAGDAFIGGFIYGLVNKKGIEDCIKLANANGALATTIVGAQKSFPSLDELNDYLAKNK